MSGSPPVIIRPAIRQLDPIDWANSHRALLDELLDREGAVLFRDFAISTAEQFEALIRVASGDLLSYKERSSPRQQVANNIYTSTEYPPEYPIFLHNENSYQQTWPLRIFFYCQTAPSQGGETPIADCRRVMARLSPPVIDKFLRKNWMYVRNFGGGFGLTWQTTFQVQERSAVEEYCRSQEINVEWRDTDRLRIFAVRPATATHPRTGEAIWFNHATFFNVSTLPAMIREAIQSQFSPGDYATQSFYGDGSDIENSVLEQLREAYRAETKLFPWQVGDVLMLDNMLMAHGRSAFAGPRKVLVGMSTSVSRTPTHS